MDNFPKSGHIYMGGRIGGIGGTFPTKFMSCLEIQFLTIEVCVSIHYCASILLNNTTGYIPLVLVLYKLIMHIIYTVKTI